MTRLAGLSQNLSAFLDMLAYAEGTSTSDLTKDDGYDVIVTGLSGPEIFNDYSKHPFYQSYYRKTKVINKAGLTSNASGRYQFMLAHWEHYRDLLKLPNFGPESQDKWAVQLIKERGALPLIEAGKFDEAVKRVSNLWASLPGAGYGQPERNLETLRDYYLTKGGKLWESNSELSLQLSYPASSESSEPGNLANPKDEMKPKMNTLMQKLLELLNRIIAPVKHK